MNRLLRVDRRGRILRCRGVPVPGRAAAQWVRGIAGRRGARNRPGRNTPEPRELIRHPPRLVDRVAESHPCVK
ncbi:hypothetical protein SCWH03_37240 [Streptomyces pacificus]|uniref:Uncharacterized protein n=1 Tax=Streptomyces pacificus TaxID=2705029 RepID=A0A6A0AX77_9ACTN|nr:hypothetical protein SCWH03_37240 [Streptomyces pacificus]